MSTTHNGVSATHNAWGNDTKEHHKVLHTWVQAAQRLPSLLGLLQPLAAPEHAAHGAGGKWRVQGLDGPAIQCSNAVRAAQGVSVARAAWQDQASGGSANECGIAMQETQESM